MPKLDKLADVIDIKIIAKSVPNNINVENGIIGINIEKCEVTISGVNNHKNIRSKILRNIFNIPNIVRVGKIKISGFENLLNIVNPDLGWAPKIDTSDLVIGNYFEDIFSPCNATHQRNMEIEDFRRYIQNFCIAELTNEEKKRTHKKGAEGFVCVSCNKCFLLRNHLLSHMLTHKCPHSYGSNKWYKLRPSYITLQHFRPHIKKKIPCIQCGAYFGTDSKSLGVQHKEYYKCNFIASWSNLLHYSNQDIYKDVGVRDCTCRHFINNSLPERKSPTHINLHLKNSLLFKHQYCISSRLKNSSKKRNLSVHEAEQTLYECSICGRKYKSMTSFGIHRKRFHLNGPAYHCLFCRKTFQNKNYVIQHAAEHVLDKPTSRDILVNHHKQRRVLRQQQKVIESSYSASEVSQRHRISGCVILKFFHKDESDKTELPNNEDEERPEKCIALTMRLS